MRRPRLTPPKSNEDLAREWDALARRRHEQIASGRDLSFTHVLTPLLLDLMEGCDKRSILDIGCGTGELTSLVAASAEDVIALDLSAESLAVARSHVAAHDVQFLHGALEDLAPQLIDKAFSLAIAAMTLMTIADLQAFAQGLASVLSKGGHFVATMAHPWFWPRYWQYEREDWFSYSQELFIEAPFRISSDTTDVVTTHVHRPLELYLRTFESCGFLLETLREPMPSPADIRPHQDPWEFPRFLGFRWVKAG